MPTNLITQCNVQNGTDYGITFIWQSDYSCRCSGTSTDIAVNDICFTNIENTPFYADHSYDIKFATGSPSIDIRIYFYTANFGSMISYLVFTGDSTFTIPSNTGAILLRLRVARGVTINNVRVVPEIYDTTYTDVDADCDMMQQVIGWPNADFYAIWQQFAGGLPWDGESCSEIACCISYLAGNVSKIYVSNYAEGMARLYQANGRFGTTPSRGAFIWFDYDHDGVPDHTGRVYDVSNGIITTVEGNVYSYVAQFTYSVNDPTIYGYGYPNYDNDPVPVPPGPEPGGNQGTYDRIRRRRAERFY